MCKKGSAGGGLTTWRLASNLSRRSDACGGEGARGQIRPRAGREIEIERLGAEGGNGGTDVLVEEVSVDGPVERVLERPAVEQAHPLLLRRPPRQVPRRRRHRPRRRRRCSFPSLSSRCSGRRVGDWGSDSDGVTALQVSMGCLDWIGHCSDIGLQAH